MQAKVSMKIGLYKKFKIASWSMSTNFSEILDFMLYFGKIKIVCELSSVV